jgi:preprotein translocase subunit SecG
MEILQTFVLVINVLSAFSVIVLVLMQHGKGADMGAAFGSGSAGSLFGSLGSANFLSRTTAVCAVVFFATCFTLAVMVAPKSADLRAGARQDAALASQISTAENQKSSKIPD